MANITELIKNIRNAIYGKDVRESIAGAIEKCYEDASENGNANMEVTEARGTFSTLNNRLNNSDSVKANRTELETTKSNLQTQINSLASGSPKGNYTSIDALVTANPETGVYVITENGHIYSWTKNAESAIDLGVYQAMAVADDTITGEKLEKSIRKIVEYLGFVKLDKIECLINESFLEDGSVDNFSGWYISEYKEINKEWKKIFIQDLPFFNNPKVLALIFFDENKTFLGGIQENTEGIESTIIGESYRSLSGECNIPNNAKYFKIAKFRYDKIESKSDIYVTTNEKTIEQSIDDINKEIYRISNILCIGDSLTQGDYGSDPAGTMNVKNENYPYFLSKFLNCNVDNKGVCGITALNYWNNKVKTIDFENNLYDIIIIMLGTNAALTDTIEEDTNITNEQNYEDYADTQTGRYCSIIEYIAQKTNSKAQIILCTPPHVGIKRQGNRNNAINSNEIIKKIGKKYAVPVIDLLNELGINDINQDIFQPIDNLHFNEKGYQKMGSLIGSKIKSLYSYFE